ncbi:nuclear GTPase SLIP-GC-like [Alosa alosa]|nr:nuclear GTPase SLIP-GC-like [Alosa alosa]
MKSVTIKLPGCNDILKNLVLMVLPGTGDIDMSRRHMWKKCLRECSTVWIISDINRAASDENAWEILTASIEELVHGGECNNIAYICTKTDASIYPEEYMSNKNLTDEDLGITEAQQEEDYEKIKTNKCIVHRNGLTKERIRHDFFKHKEVQDYFSNEDFEVFTVSSWEFKKQDILSKDLTEVPALMERLRNLNASFPEKREEDYIKEALGVLSLIQGSNCDSHTNVKFSKMKDKACSRVKKQLEDQLDKLNRSLQDKYNDLRHCLSQGAKEAEQKCLQIAESEVINPPLQTAQGYHRTLRALCQKGGVTKSNTKKITDLNGVLISPMRQLVDKAFKDLFERRSSRRLKSVAGILENFNFTSGIANDFRFPLSLILNFLETQQNKLKTTLEEDIRQMKKEIYNCLKDTIELEMRPVYKKGGSETGKGTFKIMQAVLRKGIEEHKTSMFNRATEKSLDKFNDMKAHIDKTLGKLADTAENALSPMHSVPLPDITEEVNRMKRMKKLHT